MAVYKDEYNSGKWRYRKQVSNPRTKEKKTLSKRGFTSKKEAAMAESIAISDFLNLSTFSTLPFDYVIKDYIEYKEKRLTSRSMQKITSVVNKYILPEVIDFDMRIFSPLQARDFYDNLINKDCSNNLKNYIIDQLKAIFKYGSKMYHLDNNPTQSYERFKVKKKKNYRIYTIEEFHRFNKTFNMDDPYELSYKVFVNVLFFGGPRRGEAKAIRWNDINFEKQEITIDEQFIDKDPIHGRIVCDLKTENSARTISYDEMTFRLIKKLYDYRSKDPNFQATDFLFTGPNSKLPFSDNGIRKRIEKHAHIAGLAPINPHGFRHSFASFSYGMGTDLKTISNQLGHSNTTTTMDIYVSMLNDNNEERVNKINVARRKLMIDDNETN